MLSTESIKNANQARHYFLGEDNYYTKENDATEKSQWWGKGAVLLGLKGEVNPLTFTELLQGKLPNGQQLGVIQNNKLKHRPGFDLTFSVPKSISLAALLGEDTRIYGAVQQAVDRTLERIEQCATARVTRQGVTAYENTHNLVVAKFLHDISREGDPQLHVHCAVMNMTKRSDNLWRSLASQSGKYNAHVTKEIHGFFEQVRHHKHYYGLLFRAELAHELKQLGYALEKKGEGFFELAGFSPETLAAYSTRRQQVTHYLEEKGYAGGKAAAVATLKTRKPKNINRETIHALWEARGETHQVEGYREAKEVVSQSLNPQKESDSSSLDGVKAKEAVQKGILHLSETEVVLPQIQLINTALQYALTDGINVKTILQAIHSLQASGDLIALDNIHPSQGTCFTTKKLLDYEQQILEAINKVHPSQKPLLEGQKLKAYLLANDYLDTQQKQAIQLLFTNKHQLFAIEGPAREDKTALLKPLIELTKLAGYTPVILAPNRLNQVQLKESLQPISSLRDWIKQHFDFTQYDTISRFITVQEKWLAAGQNVLPKAVLFVDQATLLSSKQMHDLIQITQQTKSRLILLGDAKSLLPWQAGSPFLQMIQAGMAEATLAKNNQNEIRAESHVLSVENKVDRLERMADHYLNLPQAAQKKACIMMPTKRACEEINILIHQKLKEATGINGQVVTVLVPRYLSTTQRTLAKHYKVGHYVRSNQPCRALGIKAGKYYRVNSIKEDENLIILQHKRNSISWNLSKNKDLLNHIELFEEKKRELLVGETLICLRTDLRKNLTKGERFYIETIQKNSMQVRRENGRLIHILLKQSHIHHVDYGYSVTPYQGMKHCDTIIAYQQSTSRQSNRRSFYKIMSQANNQVWLYTENQHQLLATLQGQTGDKATAMGTLLGREADSLPFNEQKKLLERAFIKARGSLQKNSAEENSAIQAEKAVAHALEHLSEREAAFSHKEVLSIALQQALSYVTIQDIEKALLNLENKGELIRGLYSKDGMHWTTANALKTEKRIVALAKASLGKLDAMVSSDIIESYLLNTPLKLEHANALKAIASSLDGVILLQGYAGTGKTTLVKQLETLLRECRAQAMFQLLCLAPTHTAVKELKARGLSAETLASHLVHCRSLKDSTSIIQYHYRQLIVVDESSMLPNQQLEELLSYAKAAQARLLLIGDTRQYPAIEAGKPFVLLQKSGLPVIQLTDIERQKEVTLKKAVDLVYKGQYQIAFDTLAQHVIEIAPKEVEGIRMDNREKRLAAMVEDYLSLSSAERAQTLLITLSNNERVALNAMVRERLQLRGELQGKAIETTILVTKNMTQAQKKLVLNYELDDIIRFSSGDHACGIEKNEYLNVLARQSNFLLLQKEQGQGIVWDPKQSAPRVEVYTVAKRTIQVGDLITWTKSDKALGLWGRQLAKVEAVHPEFCSIRPVQLTTSRFESARELMTLYHRDRKFQHWDHAYALTGYSAQGKTIPSVILHLESSQRYLVNPASFLVGLTRASQAVKIYTDNKQALLDRILNSGEKRSALELLACKEGQAFIQNRPEDIGCPKSHALKNRGQEIPESLIKRVSSAVLKEDLACDIRIDRLINAHQEVGHIPVGRVRSVTTHDATEKDASKTTDCATLPSLLKADKEMGL